MLSGKKGDFFWINLLIITDNISTIGIKRIKNDDIKILFSFEFRFKIPKEAMVKPRKYEPESPMKIFAG